MALVIRPLGDAPSPHLSVHLISPAGYGKTTALLSAPKPLLIGDADGGFESLFKRKVVSPEQVKDVYLAPLTTFQDGLALFKTGWKDGPGGQPFATVAMDTMSWFMSNVVKTEILRPSGREKMELQDWGLYLERGLAIAKVAHELAMRADGCHTVLTFHEADKGGDDNQIAKLGPSVGGQLFDILPGIPNFVFFLRIVRTGKFLPQPGGGQAPEMVRVFQTEADHRTPAKSRRDLEKNEPPDFSKIWEKVRPSHST